MSQIFQLSTILCHSTESLEHGGVNSTKLIERQRNVQEQVPTTSTLGTLPILVKGSLPTGWILQEKQTCPSFS